jgi:hypothetical protein
MYLIQIKELLLAAIYYITIMRRDSRLRNVGIQEQVFLHVFDSREEWVT